MMKTKTTPTKTATKKKTQTTTQTKTSDRSPPSSAVRAPALDPRDEELYRAFQSNLLSLISHELKTPLMSILNSLTLLETEDRGDFKPAELVAIARRNADRLHHALSEILDVASMESGVFSVKLRELDLERLARSRLHAQRLLLRDRGLRVELSSPVAKDETRAQPALADPQKLGRALDLCLHAVSMRAREASTLRVRISPLGVEFRFTLDETKRVHWEQARAEAEASIRAGVRQAGSAFRGTLGSEQAFLSREEEGLGAELLLVHEILRLHRGEFAIEKGDTDGESETVLRIELPALTDEEGLRAVLASRAHALNHELGSVALALVRVPKGEEAEAFRLRVQKHLFRSTDAVYRLPAEGCVALVLDDCKPEDAPRLLHRLEAALGDTQLAYGISICPVDGVDPESMVDLAIDRIKAARS